MKDVLDLQRPGAAGDLIQTTDAYIRLISNAALAFDPEARGAAHHVYQAVGHLERFKLALQAEINRWSRLDG